MAMGSVNACSWKDPSSFSVLLWQVVHAESARHHPQVRTLGALTCRWLQASGLWGSGSITRGYRIQPTQTHPAAWFFGAFDALTE